MHRPTPSTESQTHRARNEFRNSSRVRNHERAFAHRRGHGDLIDFLLRAATQVVRVGAAGDRNDRSLGMHRVGEAGNRVGEARRRVHANSRLLGDPAPGIGHVNGGLLMTRIDDAEVLVRHDVEQRQDVIAGQAENIFHAFELERLADEMTSCDSCHGSSPESLKVVSSITSPKRSFYGQLAGASIAMRFVQGRIRNKTSSVANSSRASKIHKTAR